MTGALAYDALVLVGFGGPESLGEVGPFLQRVTAGRGVPPERLQEVEQRYAQLGGGSPLNAQNRALRWALAERLAARGQAIEVVLAHRNSAPFIPDVLRDLAARGHSRVLVLATAAFASYSGCRQYREDLGSALAELGPAAGLTAVKMPPFADLPGLVAANTDLLAAVLARVDGPVRVLFSTHSIPTALAASSGPAASHVDPGLYVAEHVALAQRVIDGAAGRLGLSDPPSWSLVYQSRSGPPHVPWLEPDINEAIAAAAARGVPDIVIVPIGFLSDHVEVIWDLDWEAAHTASTWGVRMHRVPTVGTHPAFVDSLADRVIGYLRSPGRLPGADEFCGGQCCHNPRSQGPVAPGVALP